MERLIFKKLEQWKLSTNRKPLVVRGARQVGKTWLMKEFGSKSYNRMVYINFESAKNLTNLFASDYNTTRIINAIEIEIGLQIDAENTLIIFDEIQACKGAITSLKYFCEDSPQYHIVAAGSLLGVAMHPKTSFPVGKVDFMDVYPMTFAEFLLAMNMKSLFDLIQANDWEMIATFKAKLTELLRLYYFVGGMPEVLLSYITSKDLVAVRSIQHKILDAYQQDFSKHAPADIVPRIRLIWQSIPVQLSKENKKFVYGLIKQGARAKEFEMAMTWLIDAGLLHKVYRISKPAIPLVSYLDPSAFKLYFLDVGLLAAMGEIDARTLLVGNAIFEEFKGAMAEQYVLQQLKTKDYLPIFYWSTEKSTAEIDFVIQIAGQIVPIEVKAAENLQAKSLKSFHAKFESINSIRCSLSDFRQDDWLTNVPLYSIDSYVNNLRSDL